MENSHIEWTENTFNPWWGCMKVSDGCKNCYAETLDNRYHNKDPHWGPNSPRKAMSEAYWNKPLQWEKQAIKEDRKIKVFCASMADVFEDHEQVRVYRLRLFELIAITPNITWQLLTKRPENIIRFISDSFKNLSFHHPAYHMLGAWVNGTPPDNVWIGTSVENQKAAEERIPHLLLVPAKVRFLSCEPLLGPVDITSWLYPQSFLGMEVSNIEETESSILQQDIHWVIVGGESGHGARPMHPTWATSLGNDCRDAGVPFFFKQWGEWYPLNKDYSLYANSANTGWDFNSTQKDIDIVGSTILYNNLRREGSSALAKVGKKAAGSLLDGKEYKEFPAP